MDNASRHQKEVTMFRSILAAIGQGLRGAFRFGLAFLFWPFTLFRAPVRPAAAGVDLAGFTSAAAKISETRKQVAEASPSFLRDHQRDAMIAWSWVATSLLAKATQPFPTTLSKRMRTWLQGLDHDQLTALRNAGIQRIFEHCSGNTPIASVPRVRPLAPAAVRYPARIREAAHEIAEIGFRLA